MLQHLLVAEDICAQFRPRLCLMGSNVIPNIFKAYDIRGLVGTELTPDFSFATGAAFARYIIQVREPGTIVVGQDLRPSSQHLAA